MTLQEQGFRLVWRDNQAKWIHKLETIESDIDLTDFTDDELVNFLENINAMAIDRNSTY